MDVTDDRVHGHQEGAFLNTYYQGGIKALVLIKSLCFNANFSGALFI